MANVKLFDKYGNEIDHLTQWDMNVTLKITDFNYDIAPVCHFAKRYDKEAITVTSTLSDNTVSVVVPNILLSDENKRAEPIKMYVFLYESEEKSGRTIYVIDLPVETKPKPNDYEYEDNVEVVQLSELRVKLEALITKAEETINTKIDELGNSYQATITEIRTAIQADVENLNKVLTQIINSKADKSDTYTKSEVDTEIAKKADKATTLNSYGITDAYTKSEIDAELAKKINEEDVYTAEEVDERFQRILTAGDNIKIDDNKQGKITISADLSKKYDAANVESGSGDLSVYSENVPVTSAKFNYQKVGDFVMLTFTVTFSAATMSAAKSYLLLGLPYRNEIILRKPAITTSKNKLGIAIAANTATLTIITQGEAVTFSDGESIQETLIYKIKK